MNIGWLLDFCSGGGLPKALRQERHTAIDRAAAAQRDDQPKGNNQSAFSAHPQSLLSSTQRAKPKVVVSLAPVSAPILDRLAQPLPDELDGLRLAVVPGLEQAQELLLTL